MQQEISLARINKIAIPALIAGIAEPILSITDTAIIGNIDENATESLAAVGIVGTFISMLVWVFGQIRSSISSIVSQYLGANKLEEIKKLPAQAIFLVVIASLLLVAISYPLATQIFKLYNAQNLVLDYCVSYFKIRIFGFPFALFVFAVFGIFRGLQNTFYPMIIAIVGTIINIIFDVILVYGLPNFITAYGIEGAAYASLIAQISMAILSVILLYKKTDIRLQIDFHFHPEIRTILAMIGNLFVRTIALNIALYFATAYATSYGPTYIAAYTISVNIWLLAAFMIDGFSSAGNILSGKFLGAKNYEALVLLSKNLVKYGVFTGLLIALIGFLMYNYTGTIFTKEPEILEEFYSIFWLVLLSQPLNAITFIFDGMYKGMGKMKFLRNVLLTSTGFVFIPILLLFDAFDFKLYGIWIAFIAWMIARGLPLLINFNKTFMPLTGQSIVK